MKNRTALVFGGQGSQFTGMGKIIHDSFPQTKKIFDIASMVVGYDVAKMCFEAPQEELSKTIYCQICTLAVELAIYETFKAENIVFHAVAGFSLGEYAALVAIDVIDIRTAFELVKARAMAMETEVKDNTGKMAAIINLTIEQVESICESFGDNKVSIANYNSYQQSVVSYYVDCFNELTVKVRSLGGRVIPLKVNRPFHHPMMHPAADKFKYALQKQNFNIPNYKLYLNVTGEEYRKSDLFAKKLYDQIFMPVQWIKTIENMLADGINLFYEISPKPTLGAFISNISNRKATIVDVQNDLIAKCEAH